MKTPRPPGLLVLAVLALHLVLGREVQRIQDGWSSDGAPPMPARMEVDFVRELPMQPPAAVQLAAEPAPPPPASPPPAPAAPPPVPVAAADGAMQTPEVPEAASAPQAASAEPGPAPEPAAMDMPEISPEPPRENPREDPPQPPEQPASAPSLPVDAASAPPSDEPGAEWPLSTRLSYQLVGNYRGPVHGQAQVEWLRRGREYQVHLDVSLGPSFAPFVTRRMSSQGRLTPQGIAPQRYDEETRLIFGDPRRAGVMFLSGEVQLGNGQRQAVQSGAQDSASQFVQLTWLFKTGRAPLLAGHVVPFALVLPRRQYPWRYEVLGEEVLDTPLGPLSAWHVRPTQPTQAQVSGMDLVAEVWLAPSLQFLPVRLLIRQDAQTYIDMKLKRAPVQAAPESAGDIPRRLSQ